MKESSSQVIFSVILPVYNAEKYLAACLDSVIGQQEDRFEVLAVDDGSTDGSMAILHNYADRDSRIHAFHNENQGPLMTRRFAIQKARGMYAVFLDADDLLDPNLLFDLSKEIENDPHDIYLYRYYSMNSDGSHPKASISYFESGKIFEGQSKAMIYERVLRGSFHSLWVKAIKLSLMQNDSTDYAKFSSLFYGEDMVMSLQPLTQAHSIKYLDVPYYYYRNNPESIIKTFNKRKFDNLFFAYQVLHSYLEQWNISEDQKNLFGDSFISAIISLLNGAILAKVPYSTFKKLIREKLHQEPLFKEYLAVFKEPQGNDKLIKLFPLFGVCLRLGVLLPYFAFVHTLMILHGVFIKIIGK